MNVNQTRSIHKMLQKENYKFNFQYLQNLELFPTNTLDNIINQTNSLKKCKINIENYYIFTFIINFF